MVHRYCAGIPASWFSSMSLTSEPFYCYSCCQRKHAAAIEELTAAGTSLQNEVSELRSDYARKAEDPSSMFVHSHDPSAAVRCVNSHGVSGSRGHGGGGRRGGRSGGGKTGGSSGGYGVGRRLGMGNGSGESSDGGSQGAEDVNGDRPSGLTTVKVVGARRVWGTMSMCTTSTVQNVIRRVCGLSSVRVRRKTRMSPSGKQKWWFVLHDEEPTLHVLEDKWESVEMQTS